MKLFLLTLLIPVSLISFSQTLTNRQVYDFEVGDVFHITYSSSGGGGAFRDTIVGKSFSINNDTVFYQKNSAVISSTNPNYVYSSSTIFYTNLDSIASQHTLVQCTTSPPPTDTLFLSTQYCNQLTWRITSNHDPNCFEDNYYSSDLIIGCGGPYFYGDVGIGGPASYSYNLTYFKKGTVSCGNTSSTNISEIDLSKQIIFYPNPTNSKLFFVNYNSENQTTYSISNMEGKVLEKNTTQQEIDISHLEKGIYFITLSNKKGENITRKIIKE